MNYLRQILAFEHYAELNQLPDKSYRLWHALMAIDNACGWADWFTVPQIRLQSKLATSSRTTIYNARNKLVQEGLLEFKKGKRNQAPSYHLIPLKETANVPNVVQKSVPNSVPSSVPSHVPNGVPNSVPSSVPTSGPLNKLNKTKLNKTKRESEKRKVSHKRAKTRKHVYGPESTEYKLAMYLFSKIKQNNPEHKPLTAKQKQDWPDKIRLMIERDHRTPQQIKGMIDWSQQDRFWKTNILSTGKLRKQYDAMKPKANEEWHRSRPPIDYADPARRYPG